MRIVLPSRAEGPLGPACDERPYPVGAETVTSVISHNLDAPILAITAVAALRPDTSAPWIEGVSL